MNGKAIVLMGSERDLDFCHKITKYLKLLKIDYEFRVASAHKTPEQVLNIIKMFESEEIIYITVAGRSNALSAFVDANSSKLVIACPPYSEKFGGVDIFSSLRAPSGIGSVVTIEPEGAAIAVAKIFAIDDEKRNKIIKDYQSNKKKILAQANEKIGKLK